MKGPAYGRQKRQFIAESETHTKTNFRPMAKVEEVETQSYDMFNNH
jgi:hypothetical protein